MDADARPASTLASAWPLFALRIRSERLLLRLPTDDEILALIDVARDGIHPPDEMPFGVAWSVLPSPDFDRGFVQHYWLMRATWTPEDWNLNLMAELEGNPAGSQSVHGKSFAVERRVDTGSWLTRDWQGWGLGKEMREAVLAFAFDGLALRSRRRRRSSTTRRPTASRARSATRTTVMVPWPHRGSRARPSASG